MSSSPRLSSPFNVTWSIASELATFEGLLADLAGERATLTSSVCASPGDDVRIEISDDAGAPYRVALARVDAVAGEKMQITFVALGIDGPSLEALQKAPPRKGALPPPLPTGGSATRSPRRSLRPRSIDDAPGVEIEALPVKRSGIVIGIDLGTTNTCAAYVVDGRAKVITGKNGKNTIPSMITFDPDGTFHVGQRAADRQVLHPTRTVYGSKRLIGRTFKPELAADLQRHFGYPLAEAEGQRFGARIDERVISMDTIAARVLDDVRESVQSQLKTEVDAAIITVPAYFTEVQREAVRRAAAQAKLAVFRIVSEPTAAAVAYGHKQEKAARIAVWDFGGGTFDFSLVSVSDGTVEVLATGGDSFLGGHDFDDQLASHLLTEFQRIEGFELEPTPQQIARVREAAAEAKHRLSEDDEVVVAIPELTTAPKRSLKVTLTKERFDALMKPLVDRSVAIAREVLDAAKIDPKGIDDVVLVGGTTRIPAVQDAVAALFGRRPSKRINPDEAVALGAAMLAAEIGDGKTPTLLDILPMSVGRGTAGRLFVPIAERFTRVPCESELLLDADILGSVYVPLFQGESPDVTKNEYLCSILVEDRTLWDKGRVQIRLAFDEHAVMTVEAINARTGRPLPLKLDRSRPVEDVLRDLGTYGGPATDEWKLPETTLGKVLGRVFRLFGR